jgi:S1-C subfamily serine protease
VGPDGSVLTSYHVVVGARNLACRTPDGRFHQATLKRASAANDLALLAVSTRPTAYLSLAGPGRMKPGDRVFTFGYGAANYLGVSEPRFTEGSVSALSGLGAEDAYMQISVPVQPGNSGGPVINDDGKVVGIVAAQAAVQSFVDAEGTLPQNINWAVKAEYAAPLLGRQSRSIRRSREGAIANARASLCLIVADASEPGTQTPP